MILLAVLAAFPGTMSFSITPKLAIGASMAMNNKPSPAMSVDVRNEIFLCLDVLILEFILAP
jgi:hypothetical protein